MVPPPCGNCGASRSFMAKTNRLVPGGTPASENGGDLGSKHDAVPCQEKSTLKPGVCASDGLATAKRRVTSQNCFRMRVHPSCEHCDRRWIPCFRVSRSNPCSPHGARE